jgi:flagellar protein FliJ
VNSDHHFAFREAQKVHRLTAFRTDSVRRMTSQIERIIADFNRAINDLNRAIEAEHIRTHIDDPNHFAYSTTAKAMAQRRSNLVQSIDRLKHQLAAATTTRTTATSLSAAATTDATSSLKSVETPPDAR